MRRIFLTGATGVMGMAGLRQLAQTRYSDGAPHITVLARDTKVNHRKLAPYIAKGVDVVWGDLMNPADVERGVADADVVLHVGGMVSPQADWYPEKTYRVNTGSVRNIIDAALRRQRKGESVKVVYIGSVSQYGDRREDVHWGRAGDPVSVAVHDKYALSKNAAERMLIESGLKEWVSLRQSGILYPRILMKGSDPISFHVPMRGCLEWVTAEDSGRLLAEICDPGVPDSFWSDPRRFYNIGGGESYRYVNHDFVQLTLSSLGCPPVEKVFGRNWFATRNFHGIWYTDSDRLESLFHFRGGETMAQYLKHLSDALPWYFKLAPLAPAWIIKGVMKRVALTKGLGTLRWVADGDEERIEMAFGGREAYARIPGWDVDNDWSVSRTPKLLDHGYDERKPISQLTIEDMRRAAEFRGGRCLSDDMIPGDLETPLEWECSEGHRFRLSPSGVLMGGHWCGECLEEISRDLHALRRQAARNPFLRQIVID